MTASFADNWPYGIIVMLTVSWPGYVDDPRNTDNAWMETVAFHFHDDTGELACSE